MKNVLFIILCLISVISLAETKFDSLSYWTNFDDEDVKDDFVPCSVAEDKYPGPSTNARHSFEDGVLLMESAYDKKVAVALIEGGAQSEEEVLIQHVHEMVDGKEVEKSIIGKPFGVYTNTVIQMSYELTIPNTYLHTNHLVYVVSRKGSSVENPLAKDQYDGPHSYRVPFYRAQYNGKTLSICEYTFFNYADNPAFEGNVRVLASAPATTETADGTYTIKFTTMGGYDGDNNGIGGQPCNLYAELRYAGKLIAKVSAVDYPFNWNSGPEVSGDYVPQFDPTGDSGTYPIWTHAGGEWERRTARDVQHPNTDIRIPGWTTIGIIPITKIGGTKHGIKVTNFSVSNIDRSAFENVLIIR
ncbi:MAG: hypothetical protein IJ444_05285 [Kiritimatiellae bacterium]|nr:hypothetical protein [Kiritimatiellia bacterium]